MKDLHKRDDNSNMIRSTSRACTNCEDNKRAMQANKTVKINGRTYDAVTGMPVANKKVAAKKAPAQKSASVTKPSRPQAKKPEAPAASIHRRQQRSQTLQRRIVKKPEAIKKPSSSKKHMDISRSPMVSKFASHPQAVKKTVSQAKTSSPDKRAVSHPMAAKATKRQEISRRVTKALTAKQTKDAAITEALKPQPIKKDKPKKERRQLSKKWRRLSFAIASVVIVLAAAAVLYFTVPNISVGIAGQQAGINASYPGYTPDGYRFKQPIQYSDGEVVLEFTSRSGPTGYTITQSRSSWDSSAVLDNAVKPAAGDNYTTVTERGLTIYSYDSTTTWVNGGIRYTIEGNAPLTPEQKRQIATSL